MKRYITISFMLAFMVWSVMSCVTASHQHKHKPLKPGKPIPCPHKDC